MRPLCCIVGACLYFGALAKSVYVPNGSDDWKELKPEAEPLPGSYKSVPFKFGIVVNPHVRKGDGIYKEPDYSSIQREITTTFMTSHVTAAPKATKTTNVIHQIPDGQIQRKGSTKTASESKPTLGEQDKDEEEEEEEEPEEEEEEEEEEEIEDPEDDLEDEEDEEDVEEEDSEEEEIKDDESEEEEIEDEESEEEEIEEDDLEEEIEDEEIEDTEDEPKKKKDSSQKTASQDKHNDGLYKSRNIEYPASDLSGSHGESPSLLRRSEANLHKRKHGEDDISDNISSSSNDAGEDFVKLDIQSSEATESESANEAQEQIAYDDDESDDEVVYNSKDTTSDTLFYQESVSSEESEDEDLDDFVSPVYAVACATNTTLQMQLEDGILRDSNNRIGSIVGGRQFQFDGPSPQYGAIFAAGWSITEKGQLALGNSTKFYQCASGEFYNLYDEPIAFQCNPVTLDVVELIDC